REDLYKITENEGLGGPEKVNRILGPLKRKHQHSIELIHYFSPSGPSLQAGGLYNCYRHALNVHHSNEIDQVEKTAGKTLKFSSVFIKHLIQKGILSEIQAEEAKDKDIVVYINIVEPQHAGKIDGQKIISKWGMTGALWKHDIFEVPISYGNDIKYYSDILAEKITQEFFKYIKL
ncbi:hypothetical protein KA005_79080, partial [bacterium]|nr:hypothetical protein [bacterium]